MMKHPISCHIHCIDLYVTYLKLFFSVDNGLDVSADWRSEFNKN
jgi:hypothetical protein